MYGTDVNHVRGIGVSIKRIIHLRVGTGCLRGEHKDVSSGGYHGGTLDNIFLIRKGELNIMKKEMNNKGFSLVELIIVVAIMAVLIGVLAPAYLQYVEKSKKTKDCGTIGSVLDAIEIVAADPAVTWTAGDAINVRIGVNGAAAASATNYNTSSTAAVAPVATAIEGIVPTAKTTLGSSWSAFTFEASKGSDGIVDFTNASGLGTNTMTEIQQVSPALEARFQ